MKQFVKVFSIAFLCFVLAIGAGIFTYIKFYNTEAVEDFTGVDESDEDDSDNNDEDNEEEELDPLQKAIKESKRVNVLVLGLEGPRSDTIIFASFDPDTKKVNMISIPRDTYYYRKGHENADARKINAAYGAGGIDSIKSAVESIMGNVPIDHYVTINYKGVEKIVDTLGGIEVDVPFHMEYKDPYDTPPLVIDIPKGKQVLNGKKALQYLRYRHNNDMTVGYPDGDLGRIKAQQKFIISTIKKSLSFKLPTVVKTCYDYIKTDAGLTDILIYIKDVIGIKTDDIEMMTLPGVAEYKKIGSSNTSYFIHDPEKIKETVMQLYNVETETN